MGIQIIPIFYNMKENRFHNGRWLKGYCNPSDNQISEFHKYYHFIGYWEYKYKWNQPEGITTNKCYFIK
jgi:hypothetical protein